MTGQTLDPARGVLPAATPLDRRYDADRLATEVRTLRVSPWRSQRSIGQDGMIRESTVDWTILPLRSPGGDPARTDAGGAGPVGHADTPHLARAPYVAEILRGFPAQLLGVRLMALGPGARVREHRDGKFGMPWGLVRLHVPVITNPEAYVVIGGERFHWDAGRLWFGDFNRPHHVSNSGAEARVHLVLDCLVGGALLGLFPDHVADGLADRGVVLAREPVPLSDAELRALTCRFAMPARFAEWSEEEPVAGPDETVPAELTVDDRHGPVLNVSGAPAFGLVHVGSGEFRLAGWSEERTLQPRLDAAEPHVRFRVREAGTVSESTAPARR
jgi:hypothetical protein